MVANIIIGTCCILVALMPNPSYYLGEQLFGVGIMPYWIANLLLIGIGILNIVGGVWPHD